MGIWQTGSGYTCFSCGLWVPVNGLGHSCQINNPDFQTPSYPPQTYILTSDPSIDKCIARLERIVEVLVKFVATIVRLELSSAGVARFESEIEAARKGE